MTTDFFLISQEIKNKNRINLLRKEIEMQEDYNMRMLEDKNKKIEEIKELEKKASKFAFLLKGLNKLLSPLKSEVLSLEKENLKLKDSILSFRYINEVGLK